MKISKYTITYSSISGWGNEKKIHSKIVPISNFLDSRANGQSIISRGLGRSYGDSALNDTIINTIYHDKFLLFDDLNGLMQCQAGVDLNEVLSIVVKKGWFLPVTPGTKLITIGGAVAADVHGKNHHTEGSFCDYVTGLSILTGSGEIVDCSPTINNDLFYSTCGGMGLTGIIIDVTFKLKSIDGDCIKSRTIKTNSLDETLEEFERNSKVNYSVAWIDCLKKGKNMGRSLVMLGEHTKSIKTKKRSLVYNVPLNSPSFLLNKFSIKTFNNLYYHHQLKKISDKIIHYDKYFYPLDSINNWNRLYGKQGFFQYQFVVPFSVGLDGMKEIMNTITNWGQASFLAVLKTFGKENRNLLSFPIEGYTLAIDIKYNKKAYKFFDFMDKIILEMGGRIYLAKDTRMNEEIFKKSYLNWEKFQQIREKYGSLTKFSSRQSKRIGLN